MLPSDPAVQLSLSRGAKTASCLDSYGMRGTEFRDKWLSQIRWLLTSMR